MFPPNLEGLIEHLMGDSHKLSTYLADTITTSLYNEVNIVEALQKNKRNITKITEGGSNMDIPYSPTMNFQTLHNIEGLSEGFMHPDQLQQNPSPTLRRNDDQIMNDTTQHIVKSQIQMCSPSKKMKVTSTSCRFWCGYRCRGTLTQ